MMPLNTKTLYKDFKNFFTSGIFYIALGSAFLVLSSHQIGQASSHPSFIFLLSILGVAIVLYGTGTQAVGSSNTGNLNVAIAGGAGVLALVLGFGVVHFNKEIHEVFSYSKYYAVIELETDSPNANLDDFVIRAELPNRQPLHLWKRNQSIEILVPVFNIEKQTELKVIALKRSRGDTNPLTFNQDYVLKWIAKKFESRRTGIDEPVDGQIHDYGGTADDIKFSIKDQLVVTSSEDIVVTEGDQLLRIQPQ